MNSTEKATPELSLNDKDKKNHDNSDYPELSKEIWTDNYRAYNEDTLQDTWERQAKSCASVEDETIRQKTYEDFIWLLTDFKGIAGGRITANLGVSGRSATTLFNCFTHAPADIQYKDSDSIHGIYNMLHAQAQTLKSEGGYGTNFSYIRPAGSYVKGIDGRTPGVLKFMELWDKSSEIITAGSEKTLGSRKATEKKKIRKGAQMAVLSVWHPEIEGFIDAKLVEGRLTKFNISVGITTGFMDAVANNLDWQLKFPDTECKEYKSKWYGDIENWERLKLPVIIHKTVKAQDLWNKIMLATYSRNDPGVLFLDKANLLNPLAYAETIQTTNPCQPGWATVLTSNGISTIEQIKIGDIIWSGKQWTKIINKVCTGVKPVYAFRTTAGTFYGTESHKIVSNGEKIEVNNASSIDISCLTDHIRVNKEWNDTKLQAVIDGLVVGDGMMHKASNNLIVLLIGKDDFDYFTDPISSMIVESREGVSKGAWQVKTSIKHLKKTYKRNVPEQYKFGSIEQKCMFLRGLYSANGTVVGGRVVLKASSFAIAEDVQIMLSSLGIPSYHTTNKPKDVMFANGIYKCKKSYDICIGTKEARCKFVNLIGFIQKYKQKKAIESCNCKPSSKSPKLTFDIKDKEFIDEEKVYDITVDADEHTYWSGGLLVSNCGEISMSTGVCLLFSLNLVKFIKTKNGEDYEFDFETFKRAVGVATRFADNINDISNTPLNEYKISLQEKRRIGLGVLGLGSLHYILGIRFGSDESLKLIDSIFKVKAETEIYTSALLGKEKGSFPLFDRDKYFNTHWWNTIPISQEIKNKVEEIGEMRNSHHSANAPTGNMSIYAGLVSGGIEPVFEKEYVRWSIVPEPVRAELRERGFEFPDVFKGEWFETKHMKESKAGTDSVLFGFFNGTEYQIDKNRGLTKKSIIKDYGWSFVNKYFPTNKLNKLNKDKIFVTTADLSVEDHVNSLKTIAKYVNMNSSKTVNIPNDYSYEKFKDLYFNAYHADIKGITSYRAGTMTAVLETINDNNEVLKNKLTEFTMREAPKRPKTLASETHKIKVDAGMGEIRNAYITVSFFEGTHQPYEIFVNAPIKEDKDRQIMDLAARSTSMMLRHNVPIHFIVQQFEKVDNQFLYSIPTNIAKVLRKYQDNKESLAEVLNKDNTADTPDIAIKYDNDVPAKVTGLDHCPSCKLRTLRHEGGCVACQCGYSAC